VRYPKEIAEKEEEEAENSVITPPPYQKH